MTKLAEHVRRGGRPAGSGAAASWWLGPDGEPGPVLRTCLAGAITAPSIYNTQPWLFHPRASGVDIYADRERQLPVADPDGRELLLSAGAALFNLRVAVRAHGRVPVQQLDLAGGQPALVARVSPATPAPVSQTARSLAWAIPRRRSNRWPFVPGAPSRAVLAELVDAAAAEGGLLRVVPRGTRRRVLALARVAAEELGTDPAYRWELRRWTRGPVLRRDGVGPAAAGPRVRPGGVPLRDFGLVRPEPRPEVQFEPVPTIAVLYGKDSPEGWVRAGQALQRALLTATVYGLAATLLTQPLEIPQLRERLSDPATGLPAQAVLRIGYARHPAAGSPRRPLADLLLGAGSAEGS